MNHNKDAMLNTWVLSVTKFFARFKHHCISIFEYKIYNNGLCTMGSSSPPVIILIITADVAAVH